MEENENDIESGILTEEETEEFLNQDDDVENYDLDDEGLDDEGEGDDDDGQDDDEDLVTLDEDEDDDVEGLREGGGRSGGDDNPYEVFASELKDNGLIDEDLDVNDIESLRHAIERAIQDGIDARTARVDDALAAGVDSDRVRALERAYEGLNDWTDERIRDEADEGVQLRRDLIVNACINCNGMSPERAEREWQKSYKAGTDIEDAMDARDDLAKFIKDSYQDALDEAKEASEARERDARQYYSEVLDEIMNNKAGIYEGASDAVRQAVIDNDDDYERFVSENPAKAEAAQRFLFAMTNGYRDLSVLTAPQVNKQKRAVADRMEKALRNSYGRGGGMRLANALEDEGGAEGLKFI